MIPSNTVAFVTFSSGGYIGREQKLRESVRAHYPNGEVFVFHDFSEIGSPTHKQSPYSFKVYAIDYVRKLGYKVIFWCDSVVRLRKSIEPVLPLIHRVGVYLQDDGWMCGEWANDRALSYFGITRDEAMNIESIYACIMGFDFGNPITHEFFRRWKKASEDGIFCGLWKNDLKTESQDERCRGHRHDQTCAELISYQLGIPRSKSLFDKDDKYFTTYNFP
jgi:hypothetical protein